MGCQASLPLPAHMDGVPSQLRIPTKHLQLPPKVPSNASSSNVNETATVGSEEEKETSLSPRPAIRTPPKRNKVVSEEISRPQSEETPRVANTEGTTPSRQAKFEPSFEVSDIDLNIDTPRTVFSKDIPQSEEKTKTNTRIGVKLEESDLIEVLRIEPSKPPKMAFDIAPKERVTLDTNNDTPAISNVYVNKSYIPFRLSLVVVGLAYLACIVYVGMTLFGTKQSNPPQNTQSRMDEINGIASPIAMPSFVDAILPEAHTVPRSTLLRSRGLFQKAVRTSKVHFAGAKQRVEKLIQEVDLHSLASVLQCALAPINADILSFCREVKTSSFFVHRIIDDTVKGIDEMSKHFDKANSNIGEVINTGIFI